ncbi:MAG TPA: hypothetical protein DCS66_00690 [Flavobacteriaceae bacterium]|nr:hypothetical protein [Flavobacteriaceae bacterium]
MTYYINILLPLIFVLLAYSLSRFLNRKVYRKVLIALFLILFVISFPLLFTDLNANVWIYDYFVLPIFISSITLGILIIANKKYFKLTAIMVAIIGVGINFFWNFVISFAAGWGGGNYNQPFKNEPILTHNNLEIVEHKQSPEISHYMLNRTYLNGLIYRQVGFETRDNSICNMTFELRDTNEKYRFDKCNSTIKKVE